MKVLIVDDSVESLYLLNSLLTGSGHKTLTAENGLEALGKLKDSMVDIIVSDILMPKMDGFQLCRACKKDKRLRKIPFLFYTATYKRKQDEEFALSLGAERFIIKPQEPGVLLEILEEVMSESEKKKSRTGLAKPLEEDSYLAEHNRRVIKKLGDKIISLDKEIARRKKTEDELYKMVRKLDCLYSIANLAIQTGMSMDKIFKQSVKNICEGMECPRVVCSRILFDKRDVRTENFKETEWKEFKDIKVEGKRRGAIEIYYTRKRFKNRKSQFSKEEKKLLSGVSEMLRVFIERELSMEKLIGSYNKINTMLGCITNTLAYIVEARDPYTSGHQKKVAKLATAIAEKLGLDKERIEAINTASLIHDIGKIKVPVSILTKPGKLSDLEFEMIKIHPEVGYEILKNIEFPYPIAKIVAQHHEKIDGSGYPKGLKSKDISIEAKVIAVADSMEAMISDRPYRPGLGLNKAIQEMKSSRGKLYDSRVVDVCIKLIKKKSFREGLDK